MGLVAHHTMLYGTLTGRENVEFTAQLYGLADPRNAAARALMQLGVLERADTAVRALSRGLQQRVAIARAIVHGPRVLLLDEPYTGLDAAGTTAVATALGALQAAGTAVMLVTHHLDEGLALATHAAVMRDGAFSRFERRAPARGAAGIEEFRELVAAPA